MPLTKEQINKIENYLDRKELTYVDIRLEVLDHMISDIENTIDAETISFDAAFKKSVQKWYPQLKLNSSWIIGLVYNRPEIVIQKANKIFLKWFVLYTAVLIISAFIDTTSVIGYMDTLLPINFNIVVIGVLLLSATYIVIWLVKILKTKIKSSYLFLFEKQVFLASLFIALVVVTQYLTSEDMSMTSDLSLFYALLAPLTAVFGFILFKKHQKIIQKYRLAK